MVTVAEELPFVAVSFNDKIDLVCANCFIFKYEESKINLKRCGGCNTIQYCSKKCQVEDWKAHKAECNESKLALYGDDDVRMMIRLLSRVKRGDLPAAFNGRTFDDLMDHTDDIKQDESRKFMTNDMCTLYKKLVSFMGRENVPSLEKFIPLYGKCFTNTTGIAYLGAFDTHDIGAGLYLGLSAHDHSCRPNAEYFFNGSKVILRALDPNPKYSQNLTIPYITLTDPKICRALSLRYKSYFNCECERCMDEESELLERSGKSKCCPTDGAVLPYQNGPLRCSKCGKKSDLTLEEINNANNTIAMMCIGEAGKPANISMLETRDYKKMAKTLEKMESILSPFNLYLLKFMEVAKNGGSYLDKILTLEPKYYLAVKKASEKHSRVNAVDNLVYTLVAAKAAAVGTATNPITRNNSLRNGNNPRKNAAAKRVDMAVKKALAAAKEMYGSDHPLYQETQQFYALAYGQGLSS